MSYLGVKIKGTEKAVSYEHFLSENVTWLFLKPNTSSVSHNLLFTLHSVWRILKCQEEKKFYEQKLCSPNPALVKLSHCSKEIISVNHMIVNFFVEPVREIRYPDSKPFPLQNHVSSFIYRMLKMCHFSSREWFKTIRAIIAPIYGLKCQLN